MTPTGVVFLFAPGGGYGLLSLPNAADITTWAGAMGAHTAVLKYRVPRNSDDPGHRLPLSDAQRAVRLLQAKTPNELHVYARGGHGKGLRMEGYPFSTWTLACERWLTDLEQGTINIKLDRSANTR